MEISVWHRPELATPWNIRRQRMDWQLHKPARTRRTHPRLRLPEPINNADSVSQTD